MELRMGALESKFADIIWEKEPITTNELVKLGLECFEWKRTTTYTVLKRLCQRGIFQNNTGTVTSLMSRDDFYSAQSSRFVNETFSGSLPSFIAAFTAKNTLSEKEIEQIQQMIDKAREQ